MDGSRCPAAKKIYRHLYYLANRTREMAVTRAWEKANPEKVREYSLRRVGYFQRPDVKANSLRRSIEWAAKNRDRVLEASEKYRKANKALYCSYSADRRARRLSATPPWLTEDQKASIQNYYIEAARLTAETGVPHEVDHIVPLRGYTVCGLHVPWNLRVTTKEENRRRPRVWKSDAF